MRLSLILPVYNGCEDLRKNFMKIYREVARLGECEIIIAEDGSTDCSREVAERFAKMKNVRLISRKERSGKGRAVKSAIAVAKGSTIGYMDIDLAVPLRYIGSAVRKVESGNAIVLGSRYKSGSKAARSPYRLFESALYNMMVRALLGSRIRDHQCGFKFWDGRYIRKAIKDVEDDKWFFDSEILVRAQRNGIVPYEMPVEWREGRNTTVKAGDTSYFIGAMLKLRRELGGQRAPARHYTKRPGIA